MLVESAGGAELWSNLTRIGAEAELIDEVAPLDDNLEAVFEYLTG